MDHDDDPILAIALILGVLFLMALFFGVGSRFVDRLFGPDPDAIRQDCIHSAKMDKERCTNGGVAGSLFKTTKRIKACHEIYLETVAACPTGDSE